MYYVISLFRYVCYLHFNEQLLTIYSFHSFYLSTHPFTYSSFFFFLCVSFIHSFNCGLSILVTGILMVSILAYIFQPKEEAQNMKLELHKSMRRNERSEKKIVSNQNGCSWMCIFMSGPRSLCTRVVFTPWPQRVTSM